MSEKPVRKHYINNKDLYGVMKQYHAQYHEAKATGGPLPQIPEFVGLALLMIATRLASKPNYSGYSFKQEMISDGIENCLMYLHNFDPAKSTNPFAYFTQIINYAFWRRIAKEKKQHYIKIKNFNHLYMEHEVDGYNIKYNDYSNEITNEYVRDYESKLTAKKKPARIQNNGIPKEIMTKDTEDDDN